MDELLNWLISIGKNKFKEGGELSEREINLVKLLKENNLYGGVPEVRVGEGRFVGQNKGDEILLNRTKRQNFDYLNQTSGREVPQDSAFVLAHELGHTIQGLESKENRRNNIDREIGEARGNQYDFREFQRVNRGNDLQARQKEADMFGLGFLNIMDENDSTAVQKGYANYIRNLFN